ncbi:hypothetical protein A9239_16895 [Methanosarcina sp. A14]|nr:hypothetical protein A9239_16895 [Methanosarcina sp. A14]
MAFKTFFITLLPKILFLYFKVKVCFTSLLMLLTLIYFVAKFWVHIYLCKKSDIEEAEDDDDFFD